MPIPKTDVRSVQQRGNLQMTYGCYTFYSLSWWTLLRLLHHLMHCGNTMLWNWRFYVINCLRF